MGLTKVLVELSGPAAASNPRSVTERGCSINRKSLNGEQIHVFGRCDNLSGLAEQPNNRNPPFQMSNLLDLLKSRGLYLKQQWYVK